MHHVGLKHSGNGDVGFGSSFPKAVSHLSTQLEDSIVNQRVTAVSYTHLDVYKRQTLYCAV